MYLFDAPASGIALAMASSVFIDLDHVMDYIAYRRGWRGVADFFQVFEAHGLEKLFFFFHAWEWVACLALAAATGAGPAWLGYLACGLGYHLLFDHCFNGMPRYFYFFGYRLVSGFPNPLRRRLAPSPASSLE